METRDKKIFCLPGKIIIPKNIRDKSHYCAHHEDFGHLTNDCKNLYRKIMFTIKRRGLQQYLKKDGGTLRMAEQLGMSPIQKGKIVVEQRTPAVEQQLRMVRMIAGPTIANAEEEKKCRQKKRTKERVKRQKVLGQLVNYVYTYEEFYHLQSRICTQ